MKTTLLAIQCFFIGAQFGIGAFTDNIRLSTTMGAISVTVFIINIAQAYYKLLKTQKS